MALAALFGDDGPRPLFVFLAIVLLGVPIVGVAAHEVSAWWHREPGWVTEFGAAPREGGGPGGGGGLPPAAVVPTPVGGGEVAPQWHPPFAPPTFPVDGAEPPVVPPPVPSGTGEAVPETPSMSQGTSVTGGPVSPLPSVAGSPAGPPPVRPSTGAPPPVVDPVSPPPAVEPSAQVPAPPVLPRHSLDTSTAPIPTGVPPVSSVPVPAGSSLV